MEAGRGAAALAEEEAGEEEEEDLFVGPQLPDGAAPGERGNWGGALRPGAFSNPDQSYPEACSTRTKYHSGLVKCQQLGQILGRVGKWVPQCCDPMNALQHKLAQAGRDYSVHS